MQLRRSALLALGVLVPPVVVGAKAFAAFDATTVVAFTAGVAVAVLVVIRVLSIGVSYKRAIRLEHVLRECAPDLVLARTRDEICRVATKTAVELMGGVKDAFVELKFGPRPSLDTRDVVVIGGGEFGDWLRGEFRLAGHLGQPGSARTLVLPWSDGASRASSALRVTGRQRPTSARRWRRLSARSRPLSRAPTSPRTSSSGKAKRASGHSCRTRRT
jgi:hypothetical protein